MSFYGVPSIFFPAPKAQLSLPHLISNFNKSSSLLDFDFVQFLNGSDAQTPPTEEYRVFMTAVLTDKTFSQYQLDLSDLELKTPVWIASWDPKGGSHRIHFEYPTHQAPQGILVSEYNLHQWVEGSTAQSEVGFAYNGRVKCSFSVPYDYLVTAPVAFGDEIISLPFSVCIFRRDPFLTLREIRLFLQYKCSRSVLPSRYGTRKEPFTFSRFKLYCAPFEVDNYGELFHKATGYKVAMGSASALYERGVRHVYYLFSHYWHHLTAVNLNEMVVTHMQLWFVDGDLMAEYWLDRLSGISRG
ncbi:hypothetical protein AAF712_006584 [Marasmius tenuissimus]|uniref:Uncharacterized protein n=1 Tax=Marasmius tenuissimus TaxID=585030 RepID=A0ABR2ZXK4_9AGAR